MFQAENWHVPRLWGLREQSELAVGQQSARGEVEDTKLKTELCVES